MGIPYVDWNALCHSLVERIEAGQPLAAASGQNGVTAQIESVNDSEIVVLVSLPRGTFQRVGARLIPIDAEEGWIEFRTPVCEEGELDPRAAVIRNQQLVFGHLELRPETRKYWFRHTLRLDDILQSQHFAHFMGQFAGVGDSLETEITGQDRW